MSLRPEPPLTINETVTARDPDRMRADAARRDFLLGDRIVARRRPRRRCARSWPLWRRGWGRSGRWWRGVATSLRRRRRRVRGHDDRGRGAPPAPAPRAAPGDDDEVAALFGCRAPEGLAVRPVALEVGDRDVGGQGVDGAAQRAPLLLLAILDELGRQ